MRILMVSDVYFPRINGVSTSIKTFKTELEKMGHQVYLLVPDYPMPCPDDDSVIRVPSRGVVFDPEDRMMKYRRLLAELPRLKKLGLDLVHIHTPFVAHYGGVKIADALGVPAMITYHTLFEEYLYHYVPVAPRQLLRFLARRFSSRQCNQVSGVVAPTSVIVDLLRGYGVHQTLHVIPTGIDAGHFAHADGREFRLRHDIDPNATVLLNVSRVAFEKNIGVLIDMMDRLRKRHPESLLVIAGEGPARKAYMEQAHRLGLDQHVRFVGYLDRATELVECYKAANLFVFASRTETQGLVLLESMASGTPVVAVSAMGTRDVLEDCGGALITDGSVEDFTNKVAGLLGERTQLQSMRELAIAHAARWDAMQLAAKMLACYREVTGSSAAVVPDQKQAA